jgi:type III pantothenate kinase
MNLVLDLGNSRCKWALANDALTPGGAFAYSDDFTRSLDQAFGPLSRPVQVAAVSVAGAARTDTLAHWVQRRWNLDLLRFSARAVQCGVTNTYKDPAQLGADRWAALIAARARVLDAVCVVDCGTAITVDALDHKGVFRGGVIFPGVALMLSSLLQGTQGIQTIVGNPDTCLAQTTSDAVAAGVLYSLAGAIDRILDEQAAELGGAPQVLLTGGNAEVLSSLMRHTTTLVPDLVLEGVARIARAGDSA